MLPSVVAMLAACGGQKPAETAARPATDSTATVTGTVSYLQRVALPPGAVLTVQLADVSIADLPASVIAKQVIPVTTQVPIPFTITYDPKQVIPIHTYVVQARIEVDGKLRWISTTGYPVITRGRPSTVDVQVSPVTP